MMIFLCVIGMLLWFFIENEEVVRLLLSRGARVDITAPHGTPLHIAVSYGKTGAVKILLEHHADVINEFRDFAITIIWYADVILVFIMFIANKVLYLFLELSDNICFEIMMEMLSSDAMFFKNIKWMCRNVGIYEAACIVASL